MHILPSPGKEKSGKIAVQRKIGLRKAVAPCDVVTAAQVAIIMGEPVHRGTEHKSAGGLPSRSC